MSDTALGRIIRAAASYLLPLIGAAFLLVAIIHALGGPCLLLGSIACSF